MTRDGYVTVEGMVLAAMGLVVLAWGAVALWRARGKP